MNLQMIYTRPEWTGRDIVEAISDGLRIGMNRMHKERWPIKFTRAGNRVYKLERRSIAYEERKRREKGHDNPNVYTGRGRTEIMTRAKFKSFKTKAAAEAKWTARYLNLSGAMGNHPEKRDGRIVRVPNRKRFPDYRKEIERVNEKDRVLVAADMQAHVAFFFNRKGKVKTFRI